MEFRLPQLAEGVDSGTIIKVLVKPGDTVKARQEVLQVETEKASMGVQIPQPGVIGEIRVKVGDKVATGQVVLVYQPSAGGATPAPAPKAPVAPAGNRQPAPVPSPAPSPSVAPSKREFKVPDLGEGITDATVTKILVKPGDKLKAKQPLFQAETSKANMPVPAPADCTVEEIRIKVGDVVAPGQVVMVLTMADIVPVTKAVSTPAARPTPSAPKAAAPTAVATVAPVAAPSSNGDSGIPVPAGPATRRFAREMNVDLRQVSGTARGGRVTIEDVKSYIRNRMSEKPTAATGGSASGFTSKALPDFSRWGPVERKPASTIRKAIAANMAHNWLTCPMVTHFDLADITDLEDGRKRVTANLPKDAPKITMTVLAVKAIVAALKTFPQFNVSFDAASGEIIQKQYYHVGIAVDTPRGLVVPVIRDADKKTLRDIASEVTGLAGKAREGALSLDEMMGGSLTITNLGGIGGTGFTPIVNWPEVAILGMSRSSIQPVFRDGKFEPRLMLPLCLTYDHRVIDGADGARFTAQLVQILSDPIRLLMES